MMLIDTSVHHQRNSFMTPQPFIINHVSAFTMSQSLQTAQTGCIAADTNCSRQQHTVRDTVVITFSIDLLIGSLVLRPTRCTDTTKDDLQRFVTGKFTEAWGGGGCIGGVINRPTCAVSEIK
jgi:hypothetical protein